jgi:RNA 2',3'-cyclic 3'-phosphodiesterase
MGAGRLGLQGQRRALKRHYKPHVTLAYDSRRIDTQPIEPIAWQVHEFVLVHSLLGQTQYKFLAHFPLR